MPVLPSWIINPLWDQFHALLPERVDTHPLGCHRPRIPDRVIFDKLLQVLVFGCAYERVADHACSARTLRRRRDEWIATGIHEQLHQLALAAFDRVIGLDLAHLAVDGCVTKAPCGGEVAGRSPVDRGKQGGKRSLVVEGGGLPLGVVAAPANRRDDGLLAATLDTVEALGSLPDRPTVYLDAGYDYQPCRDELARRGMTGQIATRGLSAPVQVGGRWVVERAHAWLNAFGKLRWCTERRRACVEFYLALAMAVVVVRRLVRRAWTRYRWEAAPAAGPDRVEVRPGTGGAGTVFPARRAGCLMTVGRPLAQAAGARAARPEGGRDMATASVTRRRGGFTPEQLFGLSGLALLAALPLQVVGFLLHPPSEQLRHVLQPTYGPAHVVVFASWVLAMLGLPGLYARQAGRAGVLGLVGFALTMVAGCYHCYLALYEGFAVPVMARQPLAAVLLGPGRPLAHGAGALGAFAFWPLLGFPLLGVATVRARVFPRGVGWLQIVCLPVFFALMIVQAMVFGEGNAGANATSWVAGMLSVAMLYWLLFAGYAWGGARLRWPRVVPVAAAPAARSAPAPR